MELKGSQTEKNLLTAFAGESMARNKYSFFGDIAKEEGYIQIAEIFEETAGNEKEHGEIWYKILEGEHGTLENLKTAAGGEYYEWSEMYKNFAEVARKEGFTDIAEKFERTATVEKRHEQRFNIFAEKMENGLLFNSKMPVDWVCLNCGYVVKDVKSAPEKCPLCSYPRGYFIVQGECYN